MTRIGGVAHLAGAIVSTIVICLGPASPAAAQAAATERSSNAANRDQATRKPAKTSNTQTSNTQRTGTDRSAARSGGRDAWTIDNALPSGSKARAIETPVASKPDFGRLQLDTGSVGFETETRVKEGQFSDGRRVPGLETVKRDQPSYFGLSLSVPTNDKSLIPVPVFPRPE